MQMEMFQIVLPLVVCSWIVHSLFELFSSFNCLTEVISGYTEARCPMNGDYETQCDGNKRVCSVSLINCWNARHLYSDIILRLVLNKDVSLNISIRAGRLCKCPVYDVLCNFSSHHQALDGYHQKYLSTEKNAAERTTALNSNNQKEQTDLLYMYGINFAGGMIFGGSLTIMILLTAKRLQRKCTTETKGVQQNVDHGYRYETNNATLGMPLAVTSGPDENGSYSDNARSLKGSRVKTNVPCMDLSKSQSVDYSVYNHLHEKEAANMDDYDHVKPNSSALIQTPQHVIVEEMIADFTEYSEICKSDLSIEGEINHESTIKTINDDYFVLEEIKK
ncbi:uncharacterized protein LOC125655311 isoform X2 [Ostrea edulis]|uniref:uncharacterized protein LOC125655311 isoform X2 n=1 Tax=Ostrea edulis TaxID=37623 RepID=UPI0024AF6A41|nr:uncharacterized protein LOC125655311 isoform X2 [Ostrea edulis]